MINLLEKFKNIFKPSEEEKELVDKYNEKVKKALTVEDSGKAKKKLSRAGSRLSTRMSKREETVDKCEDLQFFRNNYYHNNYKSTYHHSLAINFDLF